MLGLNKILHKRYKTINDIKIDIEKFTNKKVTNIFVSQSERISGCDCMLDLEFENDDDVYTIFYLLDNARQIYITEI